MNKILNLTQHVATQEQLAAGVVDLDQESRSTLAKLLTFEAIPSSHDMARRACKIAQIAEEKSLADNDKCVMVGGAPFFMSTLERVLMKKGFDILYAFSKRESVERMKPDGSFEKTAVFRHAGFVAAIAG